MTFLSEITV